MERKNTIFELAVVLIFTMTSVPSFAASQLVPGEKSTIYYKIGGGEPISGAANPTMTTIKIGLAGTAKLNYSCGKFDAGITIQNLMNSFASLGTTITGAVKAGIASLPLYILQRASPGLYELFQTYQKKAEAEWNIGLKSCEEMEGIIRNGGDPYEDWIKLAKGEAWKDISTGTTDVVQAKTTVESNNGKKGVSWIGGTKAGGEFQNAIQVVRDVTKAGYNVTMNAAPGASPVITYPPTTKLSETWPNATVAADWAVSVVGDRQISLCDNVGCQAKASIPGAGLLPKFETERPLTMTQLKTAIAGTSAPKRADLEAASAPGVVITRELVDAIRAMRPVEQEIAVGRISMEVAQARIIDRALMIRNAIQTGAGVPEAGWEPAQKEAHLKIEQLNRYIDDLLFETRVRREVVSATANILIDSYRFDRAVSNGVSPQSAPNLKPLENGRVK
mgnify:FL=1